ncbi:hypothetical protein BN873_150317 [Candidatus Competibacter denitrificans Run_A_D11]|uniref:Uncharacterized protein n=1 Tax=Candidatus Competibacter denitrificans Run_A_D11 TaxID=1400863 RepID=W6M4I0_9GAMM|nr:hypothetical protein BN873_150317 [Candidatus Competibacter denitrificans Run_A_D11]
MTDGFLALEYQVHAAGIAQLVEHNLAKVGVASSSLVSRSRFPKPRIFEAFLIEPVPWLDPVEFKARWQSGHAAACKAVDAGSIPTLASKLTSQEVRQRPAIKSKPAI